jgi:AcrR family transcriptional regulator
MTVRNAEMTQETLIRAAFEEIYAHGFQAASMNEIIKKAGATKGAMYHHFESKVELGYAVIDKVIRPLMAERWLEPLRQAENPIDALIENLKYLLVHYKDEALQHGCPVGNLAHEMSSIDEGFRLRIRSIIETWQGELSRLLMKGQEDGLVRNDIDPDSVGCFLIASIEGAIGVAKNSKNDLTIKSCGEQLIIYLESLRANSA